MNLQIETENEFAIGNKKQKMKLEFEAKNENGVAM